MVFIPRAQPHAQSLFLFPIVFGINLIHFFNEKKDGAADRLFCCFDPLSRHLTVRILRRMRTVSNISTFWATESVNSAPFKRGETKLSPLAKLEKSEGPFCSHEHDEQVCQVS